MFNEPQTNRPWTPAVDIYETENDLVVKADLPDVDLKDIDVRVENQTLTIAGERKFEKQDNVAAITASSAATATSRAASRCPTASIRENRRFVQERRAERLAAEERSSQAAPDQDRSTA